MPRRLKSYQTSIGFFDLAIAAPSMKAAAEAWGTDTDVFKRGFAKETHDAAVVTATMARPGVVLKRPVGSNDAFSDHAELPRLPNVDRVEQRPTKPAPNIDRPSSQKADDKASREAALAFEREHRRREIARKKEEADREKARKRREQLIAKAESALARAEREHELKVSEIEKQRAKIDALSQAEETRWEKQKEHLEALLRRAKD
jgi:colicin import membrane protein